jgi:uncharacterized repeat protein (TIGR03803 family)
MRTRFRQIVMVAAGLTLPFAASAKALKPQILVSFTGAKGIEPQGTLVADAAGNLYGTNQAGGAAGKGTVFELSPPAGGKKAWTTKLLFTFTGSNGSLPVAGLVFDKAGNLYGTALTGGASGDGAVFELVAPATGKAKWTEKLLFSFGGSNGLNPQAGVIFDTSGNLYGAAIGGGASSAGTVFRLTPPTGGQTAWTLTTLFSFNGTSTGDAPTGTLIMDKAGNIYGTTVDGGTANDGIAYELSPPSGGGTQWTEKVLASFGAGNGIQPYAGLVADSSGNLYGTTTGGGAFNHGTVFELTPPGTWTEKALLSFDGTDGAYPFPNLAIDASSNLFGATGGGGKKGKGTVFELTPPTSGKSGWTETVLTSFTGKNGEGPSAGVLLNSNGDIFGTTVNGGKHNDGTVFKLTP